MSNRSATLVPNALEVRSWSVNRVADYFAEAGLTTNRNIWLKNSISGEKLLALDQAVLLSWRGELTIAQISQISMRLKEIKEVKVPDTKAGHKRAPPNVPCTVQQLPSKPVTANIPANKMPPFNPMCEDAYEVPIMSSRLQTPQERPCPPTGFVQDNSKLPAVGKKPIRHKPILSPDLPPKPALNFQTPIQHVQQQQQDVGLEEEDFFTDDEDLAEAGNIYEESAPLMENNDDCQYEALDSKSTIPEARVTSPKKPQVQPQPSGILNGAELLKATNNFFNKLLLSQKTSKTGKSTPVAQVQNRSSSVSETSETTSLASSRGSYSETEMQPWYFAVDREEAERLLSKTTNGTFLVRRSVHGGPNNPYTLSVYFKGQCFHIHVRKRTDGLLALGFEKENESSYQTLASLISYYMKEKLELHRGSKPAGTTRLTQWPQH